MSDFKKYIFLVLIVALTGPLYAQLPNPYKLEEEGQILHPTMCSEGIFFTDNYSSAIYLLKKGKLTKIVSSPNCGRDFSVSPDGSQIAFKYIDSAGYQSPAIYSIETSTSELLHKPARLCGQPIFWGDKGLAHTVGNTVFILDGEKEIQIDLPNYYNQIAVAPDGSTFVWNDEYQQLFLHNLTDADDLLISPAGISCLKPVFSPDGEKIVFNSIGGQLFVYSLTDDRYYEIGTGGNPVWASESENLIFERALIDNFRLLSSDLFICDFRGRNSRPLTLTPDVFESQPCIFENSKLLFSCVDKRQLWEADLDLEMGGLQNVRMIFEHRDSLPVNFYPVKNFNKNRSLIDLGDMPYVNQVYDTPDFHDGSGSCGPTTAVMALASFNIVPPWPTGITKLYFHVNDYGSYVADKYHFNGNYFDTYTSPYMSDAWGAYSYMWATGSPSSTMRNFYQLHGLNSTQSWTTSCSFADTKDEIDLGYPHSLCHYMTTAGHITLAKGYIENQFTLLFHDPNGDKNTPGYPSYDGQNVLYDWPGYNNGYQNLDATGTHGGIAWSVTTHKDAPVYSDTIVDDLDFGHGFYIFNEPPSHMKYFRDQTSGFEGHAWWTITIDSNNDVCYVTWNPKIAEAGLYEVSAYIPANSSNAQQAKYYISTLLNIDEVVINQSDYSNEWVLLGYYQLSPMDSCQVYLGDNTGVVGEQLAFDAIRFSRAPMVSVQEIRSSTEKIKVFPNPASNEFTVVLPSSRCEGRVELINTEGQILKVFEVFANQQNLMVNVQELGIPKGLFIIRYWNGFESFSEKVIVE